MNHLNSKWRFGNAIAWIGLLIAVLCTVANDVPMAMFGRAAVHHLSSPLLQDLAIVSGISDDWGKLDRNQALNVEVVQEGGATWIREEILESIDASPHFNVGPSPHIVHIEVVDRSPRLLVRLKLWRNGWEVLSDQLIDVFTTPWVPVIVLGIAGILASTALGPWWSLMICSLVGEAWLTYRGAEVWEPGPIFLWLSDQHALASETTDTWLVSIAVTLCIVAIFFHYRSKKNQRNITWWRLAIWVAASSIGGAFWLDIAFRSSYIFAINSWPGRCSVLGIILVWCSSFLYRFFHRVITRRNHS